MKVLVVNWRDIKNPEAGGAEVHIDEILKRKPKDWQIDFVSSTFKGCLTEETLNGYRIVRIPDTLFFHIHFKKYWQKRLANESYDLVIDDVSKIPLATPKYIKNVPILAIDHHIHGKSLFSELLFPFAAYVYLMERHYLRYYTNTPLIACSESTRDELKSLYDYKRIEVLYNGIDFQKYRENLADKTPYPSLVTFGRMKKYKRVDHLILAFEKVLQKYPEARFTIGGKGNDEKRLREIVHKHNLQSSVDFIGFVSESEMAKLLSRSWVFGISSMKEGWAIVNIEANAAGTPVVGYDVEGVRNSVKPSVTGFLAQNGSIESLAENIANLFSDNKLRDILSSNAVEWASKFSWDTTAADFYALAAKTVKEFTK